MGIAIESAKAASDAAKGNLFMSFSFAGAIINFFDAWSTAITTTTAVLSALAGIYYHRRGTISKLDDELRRAIRERTKTASPEELAIIEKYLLS